MPQLQRLRADHAPAILAFEVANRGYFAASVSDRGDEFFEQFSERLNVRLEEQEAGAGAYYVLVEEDGTVLGRFNLVFVERGVAELGYRVAEHVAGRGVATATVRDLCRMAASRHGVRRRIRRTGSGSETSHQRWTENRGADHCEMVPCPAEAEPAAHGSEQIALTR